MKSVLSCGVLGDMDRPVTKSEARALLRSTHATSQTNMSANTLETVASGEVLWVEVASGVRVLKAVFVFGSGMHGFIAIYVTGTLNDSTSSVRLANGFGVGVSVRVVFL